MSRPDQDHADLVRALLVERYRNHWWKTTPDMPESDDDITCARRRREMAADFAAHAHGPTERKATAT